jgi:predicted transcriptional regulator
MDVEFLDEEEVRNRVLKVLSQICNDLNVGYLEISDVLNTDSAYIFKLLKGKKRLTFSALIKLTYALNVLNERRGRILDEADLKLSTILKRVGL